MQKDLESQPLNDTLDPSMNQSQGEFLKQQNNSMVEEKLEESKIHEYANGCKYDGQWRANRRHG